METSFIIWFFFVKEPIHNNRLDIESFDYTPNLPYEINNIEKDFEFDDLIIKISGKYELIKLDNQYSIYNGKNILKIPVTITNKSDKMHSLNLFYYDIFDDLGNNIDEVAGYFDESLYYSEDLEPNKSYNKYIYALYYGNDYYSLRIKNKEKTIFIKYIIK